MQITPTNLQILFSTIETRYKQALTLEELVYQKIATTYPATSEQVVVGWLSMTEKLREWNGARVVRTPAPQTYTVPIKLFEQTQAIDMFKVQDDQYQLYFQIVEFMGKQAAKFPDYQFRDLLQNQGAWTGAFQNGVDGITHFNTAHLVDVFDAAKGTYANDYTNGGVTVNTVLIGGSLTVNGFATVWEDMTRRKSESGESQEVIGDTVMVGPMLFATGKHILEAQFTGAPVIGNLGTAAVNPNPPTTGLNANAPMVGSTANQFQGWSKLLMWRDLGGSGSIGGGTFDQVWYVLDTGKPVKPLSWFQRQAPQFAIMNQLDNPVVFATHQYTYGVTARGACAWAQPFLSSRSGP